MNIGVWRSLVAHLPWEQVAGGSNPSAPTIVRMAERQMQLSVKQPSKGYVGSSPTPGTTGERCDGHMPGCYPGQVGSIPALPAKAAVAQLVEHLPFKQHDGGSNPSGGTIAFVAQLAELPALNRHDGGSSPSKCTIRPCSSAEEHLPVEQKVACSNHVKVAMKVL